MGDEKVLEDLLRKDERLSSVDWPELEPIDNIALGPADCIVVGMGFEERALVGLKRACEASKHFHTVLIRYLPKIEENQETTCLEFCRENNLNFEEFEYDREYPSGMGLTLANNILNFEKIFLDVSGMSRLLIVQIIVELMKRKKKFHILYTEAENYPPSEQEYKEEYEKARTTNDTNPSFISSGIFEIVSSPELSSVFMLGGTIRLISFPSFDHGQLSHLVQEVQPTHNDVIHGMPPHEEMAWRTKAISQLNESTMKALQRAESHETSTLDYRETLNLILELYQRHSMFDRFVIAPTGSKMQAVAIGILRGVLADVQIVYPTPLQFVEPDRYTEGAKQIFHLAIDCVDVCPT
ncbi:MAG: hypothetical protein OXG03_01165 [Gammaproteobacteria bacterium]|nr:hypothetical protein [Gammaproteobacteria bacterium]